MCRLAKEDTEIQYVNVVSVNLSCVGSLLQNYRDSLTAIQ